MGRSRRRFTREFKLDAVKMLEESDMTSAEVAQTLGLGHSTVDRWRRQFEEDPESAFPGNGKKRGPDAELHEAKKEIARLRMENDILKKAAAYFAKHQR